MKGYLAIVLHAHLPFVKHPEFDEFLEEDWYFEAAVETYLPLLEMMRRLTERGIPFKLNLVITPTLAAMMEDPHHKARLRRYLERTLELSYKEIERTKGDPDFGPVARFYNERLRLLYERFTRDYHEDLLDQFASYQEQGVLEILTCAATHGFLPLLANHPPSVEAQIRIGVEEYERHFGSRPKGIWLPESAYFEGLEEVLARYDIRYFIVDTHGLRLATPPAVYDVYAPIFTPSGTAVFARDPESSKQVWSAKEGYPGDPWYREFYRDIGYDLPFDYIRPYVQPTGLRKPVGLKYHRITGDVDLSQKAPYNREMALSRAEVHAGNFVFNRTKQIEYLSSRMDRPPIVVAPYDAELFGHWWFEGPEFLEFVFTKAAREQDVFTFVTLSEYLQKHPINQVAVPAESSWGDKGYFDVWLNGGNAFYWRHILAISRQMSQYVTQLNDRTQLQERILRQMAREVLLAQASDWPFLITTKTAEHYAKRRIKDHVVRFLRLAEGLKHPDIRLLELIEQRDSLFPWIDPDVFEEEK